MPGVLERHQLLNGGFVPLPLAGKRPILDGWQSLEPTHGEIALWPRGNTGVLNRNAPAVDIDVLNVDVANQIEAMAFELVGPTLVRVGRAPKRALLYRTEVPFAKIRTPRYEQGHVEVLCDGQQIVCFGIHPETGRAYEWSPHPPVKRADLPVLDEAVAREIIARAKGIMEGAGWTPVSQTKQGLANTTTFSLQVAGSNNDELPKPIYVRLLHLMPLAVVNRRQQRWAASILKRLIALPQGRNDGLCRAMIELRALPISSEGVRELVVLASVANGYVEKVGLDRVHEIITAMFQPPEGRTVVVRESGRPERPLPKDWLNKRLCDL
jgi:hypothetical protein